MRKILTAVFALSLSSAVPAADYSNELALIEAWLAGQRAYDRVPGLSVAIMQDQEVLWSGGFGQADLDRNLPARADTIYGICSISKLFTGIAVMQLRDQGKFRLDDPIGELLPWYNLEQAHEGSPPVTLRAVLTHSAGLPRESDVPYWMPPDFPFPSREKMKKVLGSQSTLYPADRYYQYSNLGLTLAGEVVAEISAEEYAAYVEKHILEPLGLEDTDTGFPTDERQARIATGYAYPGRDHQLKEMPRYDTRAITPAAGFASTALDLGRFASWQFRVLNGQKNPVLAPNTLREMQRVQWLDWDWNVARGLAFGVYRVGDRTLTGHAGDCPGFNTRLYLDPLSQFAVAVLANRNRVGVDGYAAGILDILEAGLTSDEPPVSDRLDDYVGSYDMSPWDGELLVFRSGNSLGFTSLPTMDPAGSIAKLRHAENDRFHIVRSDDENGAEVLFLRDDQGRVSHLKVHSMASPRLAATED